MKNFFKVHKLADKIKFKIQNKKDEKNISSIPIDNRANSQNEKSLFGISKRAMKINLSNSLSVETHEQNKLILCQRCLLLMGELIFSGTYVNRRKNAQKMFYDIFKDVDIEKLNKMSRKQKSISYSRIKIGIQRLTYEKNIRMLLKEGKSDEVCIIVKESRKFLLYILMKINKLYNFI
jgi:hypothetical protein